MIKSIAKKSTTGSLPPAVPLAITPTFSPWTHTSDDSYIYQLSLVLATARATATVSFSFPFISFAFLSLSFLVIPQIRGHITGASPLLPTRIRALLFYREKISVLSSLVDSRRVLLTHARRSQHLVRVFRFFLQINSQPHHGGIRTHGPTPVAFEGYR